MRNLRHKINNAVLFSVRGTACSLSLQLIFSENAILYGLLAEFRKPIGFNVFKEHPNICQLASFQNQISSDFQALVVYNLHARPFQSRGN